MPAEERHADCILERTMDLEAIERQLRQERSDLSEALAHVNDALSRARSEDGELSVVDQHIADIATDTELRELDVIQRQMIEDRMLLLDDALERIAGGRFGRCVVCDRQIAPGRLEALPWTPYCLDHASLEPARTRTSPQRADRA